MLSDKLEANFGYLYENALAQIIKSKEGIYFIIIGMKKKGKRPYEIDFLISSKNKIIPIEVKSGNIKNHKSLDLFIERYSHIISKRILFSQKDISNDKMIEIKPIYLSPALISEL